MVYEWILTNKELLKVAYALSISFICAIIVLKADRLFKVSDYQGLRYFRNAFFFYGMSFIIRFIIGVIPFQGTTLSVIYPTLISMFFEFFIIVAGFLLFYTLIWKHVERHKSYHSFFNRNMFVMYACSFVLILLNILFDTANFMYGSQIAVFMVMSVITLRRLQREPHTPFSVQYAVTMVLGLFAWILNALLYVILNWDKAVQIYLYTLNLMFFILILFGALKITNTHHGKKARTS